MYTFNVNVDFSGLIKLFKKVWPLHPKRTLKIAWQGHSHFWWCSASQGETPLTQIIIKGFMITNISDNPIRISAAKLKKTDALGITFTEESSTSKYWGDYEIPVGHCAMMDINFFIEPTLLADPTKFFWDKVAIIDQYGNKHWTSKIKFINPQSLA